MILIKTNYFQICIHKAKFILADVYKHRLQLKSFLLISSKLALRYLYGHVSLIQKKNRKQTNQNLLRGSDEVVQVEGQACGGNHHPGSILSMRKLPCLIWTPKRVLDLRTQRKISRVKLACCLTGPRD